MSKTVLITGATSGFGAAAVRRFAAAGWKVVATGRRAARLQPLVDEFGADTVHAAAFDIRDAAAMEAALAALPPAFRSIDLLVNNAGLAQGTAPAQHASLDDWRTMIDTNVTALVTLTHRLLPTLVERKGVIMVVPHLGSWEMYGQAVGERFVKEHGPITALFRPARKKWIADLVEGSRDRPAIPGQHPDHRCEDQRGQHRPRSGGDPDEGQGRHDQAGLQPALSRRRTPAPQPIDDDPEEKAVERPHPAEPPLCPLP